MLQVWNLVSWQLNIRKKQSCTWYISISSIFYKKLKNVSCEDDRCVVETQLCKLLLIPGTSETIINMTLNRPFGANSPRISFSTCGYNWYHVPVYQLNYKPQVKTIPGTNITDMDKSGWRRLDDLVRIPGPKSTTVLYHNRCPFQI